MPIRHTPESAPSQPHNPAASAPQQKPSLASRPYRRRAPEPDIQIKDLAENGTAELRLKGAGTEMKRAG